MLECCCGVDLGRKEPVQGALRLVHALLADQVGRGFGHHERKYEGSDGEGPLGCESDEVAGGGVDAGHEEDDNGADELAKQREGGEEGQSRAAEARRDGLGHVGDGLNVDDANGDALDDLAE